MQSEITVTIPTTPINPVALITAMATYDRLVSTGQIDPKQIIPGAYIRALYLDEIKKAPISCAKLTGAGENN